MSPDPQFPADLVILTEEILTVMETFIFCAVIFYYWRHLS